jgi:hypothetical protein
MELNILESYGHHSLGKVKTSKQIGTQMVEVVTLSDFCKQQNIKSIDFLKVDVEGFEIEVFEGGKDLFLDKAMKLVAFEISKVPLESLGKSEQEIFNFLDQVDYNICYMNGEEFDTKNYSQINHLDLIAIPRKIK